jgi:hypothetical protein
MVHRVKPKVQKMSSFDTLIGHIMERMEDYKNEVNKLSLTKSDRSKLLALPFFTFRKTQGPAPQKGQWQYDLFTEIAGGKHWEYYDDLQIDPEEKINIFEYEKHLAPSLLENIDTNSEEFKKEIKLASLLTKTQYEKHKQIQESYRSLMNIFSLLNEDEGRSLIHLINSKGQNDYLHDIHGGHSEKELAKISEKANYESKNQYLLEKRKLNFAKQERMPVEKAKIKDVIKNQDDFKLRFNKEFGLFEYMPRTIDYEKRMMSIFDLTAEGPLAKLRDEIGLRRDKPLMKFMRVKDFQDLKSKVVEDPVLDHGLMYFMNSLFLPLDMTDYEDSFSGPAEFASTRDGSIGPEYVFSKLNNIFNREGELVGVREDGPEPNYFITPYFEEEFKAKLEAMEEEEEDDEEGEGEEEEKPKPYKPAMKPLEADKFTDHDYEEPEWPYEFEKSIYYYENPYFNPDETVTDRFNDVELDSFMKFLNVQPFFNWRDTSSYHSRTGAHVSEDLAQKIDPEYHILGEVEREHFERNIFSQHRKGSTVRFVVDNKKPRFH